ncbi:MAG: hypothetical protein KME26_26060 [Oscillatoria princeps RMCB-10]|nr:hypothetical protein [Oscillatoria princeps RMCB-10]
MPEIQGVRINPAWGTAINKPANKGKNLPRLRRRSFCRSTALASKSSTVGNFSGGQLGGGEKAGMGVQPVGVSRSLWPRFPGVGERETSVSASRFPDRERSTAASRLFRQFSSGREGTLLLTRLPKRGRFSLTKGHSLR